jgi:hypothetical protein
MQLSIMFKDLWQRLGGTQAATEIDNIIRRVTSSFHKEHQADDTHGVVHAISISEHGRVCQAEWIRCRSTRRTTRIGRHRLDPTGVDQITFQYGFRAGRWHYRAMGYDHDCHASAPILFVKIPGAMGSAGVRVATANVAFDNGVGL